MKISLSLAGVVAAFVFGKCCAVAWCQEETVLVPHASWTCGMPEGIPAPERGKVILTAEIPLDAVYDVGQTPYGHRQVIVTQGGTVSGEKLQDSVMPGGLDFELIVPGGAIEVEQILALRSNDGKYILMHSAGTGLTASDVRMVFDFEAPTDSNLAWLNSGKFVGRRTVDAAAKTMKLAVYDVVGVPIDAGAPNTARIEKSPDLSPQPWDYRRAAPGEQRGEAIVTEIVALGRGQRVGASKRGSVNIIPITGGTLSGTITGKVLFGGADYQNLTSGPTIDARYLWQTDTGDIIIVRNTGPIGSLVPTFETRTDGKYSWLNSGKYLSSNPSFGAGGLNISMYRSEEAPANER